MSGMRSGKCHNKYRSICDSDNDEQDYNKLPELFEGLNNLEYYTHRKNRS